MKSLRWVAYSTMEKEKKKNKKPLISYFSTRRHLMLKSLRLPGENWELRTLAPAG